MDISTKNLRDQMARLNLRDFLPDDENELLGITRIARQLTSSASGKLSDFVNDITQRGTMTAVIYKIGHLSRDHVVKASAPGAFSSGDSDGDDAVPSVGLPLLSAFFLVGLAAAGVVALVAALAASEFIIAALVVLLLYIYIKNSFEQLKKALARLGALIAS